MKKGWNRSLSLLLSLLLLVGAACMDQIHVLAEDAAPGAEMELAREKPTVATHYQEGNGVAAYAVDGNFGTKWSTYGYNNIVPVALQVDLEMQADLSRLGMSWYGSGRIFNYEVYVTDEAIVSGETVVTEGLAPVLTGQGNGSAQQAEACEYTILETAASGRYVTVVVTSFEGNAAFAVLAELEVWGAEAEPEPEPLPTGLTELAQNKNVTASFSQEICPAENAVDGDIATRWSSYGSELPQALMIDMDAIVSIGYLNLLIFQQNRVTDFDVYLTQEPLVVEDHLELGDAQPIGRISGEGVGDGRTNPEDWTGAVICRTDFSVTGRYLTLVGVAATSGTAAGFWEVEAYGEVQGPVIREILSVSALSSVMVDVNDGGVEDRLPATVQVNLQDDRSALLPVAWDLGEVSLDAPGDYTIEGVLDWSGREEISNPANIKAQITICVRDQRQEAIAAVEALIAAVGEITQENYRDKLAPIEEAEQAVNELTDSYGESVKESISNLDALTLAREDYDRFYTQNQYTLGDVNHDTQIDASDALLILQHSVKLIVLEEPARLAADVNADNAIDASDALKVLQYSVNLISEF